MFTSITILLYLLQTLAALNLHYNEIGNAGAQAIGQGLQKNQVRHKFIFFTSISDSIYLLQTLTILDLSMNQIEAEGAQAIAQALEINQVRYIFSFFTSIIILLYFYRNSPHLTLNGIKSELQVYRQLAKHCKEIK